jgi:hypothetical protein
VSTVVRRIGPRIVPLLCCRGAQMNFGTGRIFVFQKYRMNDNDSPEWKKYLVKLAQEKVE